MEINSHVYLNKKITKLESKKLEIKNDERKIIKKKIFEEEGGSVTINNNQTIIWLKIIKTKIIYAT